MEPKFEQTQAVRPRQEVLEVSTLNPKDIEAGDRVFIKTSSGNRYLVRYSLSNPGMFKIYNEREEVKNNSYGKGYFLHNKGEAIAELGKNFDFIVHTGNM